MPNFGAPVSPTVGAGTVCLVPSETVVHKTHDADAEMKADPTENMAIGKTYHVSKRTSPRNYPKPETNRHRKFAPENGWLEY